jgi:type I restriction enzyme S subunit
VKPGYKQTEVGVIPQDWNVQSLGALVTFLDGDRRPVKSADREKMRGQYPYYGASGIVDYVNDYLFDEDLILLGEDGENILSRNTRLAFRVSGKVWVNNHAHVLRPNPNVNIAFLTEFLESIDYEQYNSGTAQPKLNKQTCFRIPVALPPTKAEQEAIATILSDVDALIESLEQLIAKKRRIKQGAMQELLSGKRRLPGFETKQGFKQTEVGLIPQEWEVHPLGCLLVSAPTYGINAPAVPFDSRYPTYLRITDISEGGRFIRESKVSVNHYLAANYVMADGDLVFARTGASVGKSYLYDESDGVLVFAGFLILVRADETKLSPAFLKHYTQTRPYWNWVIINSTRTGQPGINGKQYAALPVPLPPTKAEQDAIAAILSDMDSEIEVLEAKLTKTRQIKQGMMQELLTGRIRLV